MFVNIIITHDNESIYNFKGKRPSGTSLEGLIISEIVVFTKELQTRHVMAKILKKYTLCV